MGGRPVESTISLVIFAVAGYRYVLDPQDRANLQQFARGSALAALRNY
jgi:hypothetical protein